MAVGLAACTPSGTGQPAPSATVSAVPSASTAPATVPPVAAGASVPDVVEQLEPSVVTVRVGDGLGSGVVYRPDT